MLYKIQRRLRAPLIPYPLSAMKISIDICPLSIWWKPSFVKLDLNERRRADGDKLWWARWLIFQISYGRLL